MNLSILIVNFNVSKDVVKCIEGIYKFIENSYSEIIVIDNNSNDKSIDYINLFCKDSKLITLSSNLGFAKANNIGVKSAVAEYLCFLNPDTIVIEDFITPLVSFINSNPNPNIGACAPMLLYEDMSYQSSTGFKMGFIYEFLEAFMLIGIYRKIKQETYEKLQTSGKPVKVGWVSGACLVIKKSVFDSVGGFTEDYFLNYEDIDLCKKLEDKDYSNYYFPYLKCIHLDHKSFDKNYQLLVYSRYRSRLIYAKINYNFLIRFFIRIIHLNGLFLRLLLVNFIYSGKERISRKKGYFNSLKLYLGMSSPHIP